MLNSDNALPTCGELCGMRDTSNPTDGSKIIDTLMAGIPAAYYNSSDDIHYFLCHIKEHLIEMIWQVIL